MKIPHLYLNQHVIPMLYLDSKDFDDDARVARKWGNSSLNEYCHLMYGIDSAEKMLWFYTKAEYS